MSHLELETDQDLEMGQDQEMDQDLEMEQELERAYCRRHRHNPAM